MSTKDTDEATHEIADLDDLAATPTMSGWVDAGEGWTWGDGIGTFDGVNRGIAVDMTPMQSDALNTTTSISLVQTREEIYEALAVSNETSGSYGLASASATFRLAESVKTTGFDLYLVTTATAYGPRLTSTTNVELTEDAYKLLETGQFADFVAEYGNRFVDGMQYGAIYAGILQIHAQSAAAQQEISVGVGAAVKTGALNVENQTDITSTVDSYSSLMTTDIVEKAIGGAPQSKSPNFDKMIMRALNFASTVTSKNLWPMYARLSEYTRLHPPDRRSLATFMATFRGPEQTLEQRRSDVLLLGDRLTAARAAYQHPESYAATTDAVRGLVSPEISSLPGLILEIATGTDTYVTDMQDALSRGDDPTTVQPTPYSMPTLPPLPPAQPGVAYAVRSGTGYNLAPAGSAVLHFDDGDMTYDPAVVLADADAADVSQRWMLSADPPASGSDRVIGLVNGDSKQGLSTVTVDGPVITDNEQQVVAEPASPPPAPGWDVLARSDGSVVIRMSADHTSNLNALEGTLGGGDAHAGTPVGLFEWGGGNANEIWYLDAVPYFDPGS